MPSTLGDAVNYLLMTCQAIAHMRSLARHPSLDRTATISEDSRCRVSVRFFIATIAADALGCAGNLMGNDFSANRSALREIGAAPQVAAQVHRQASPGDQLNQAAVQKKVRGFGVQSMSA